MRVLLFFSVLFLLSAPKMVVAAGEEHCLEDLYETISATSIDPVKSIIVEQLQAIRDRDDRAAYNLSTAAFDKNYDTPQSYMRHLRREKSPLYDHVHYEILPSPTNNPKFHKVKLIDRRGHEALALFKMSRDAQNDWRIDKVLILETSEAPI